MDHINLNSLKKIQEILIKNINNLSHRPKILITLSGGPDSTLCFLLLINIYKKYNYSLGVIVINHKKFIQDFYQEENYIKNLCKYYGIPLHIYYFSQECIYNNNQNKFRNFRWEKFMLTAYEHNYNIIITGHNLEDNIDTYLMRIGKGTSLWGLSSIWPIKTINNIHIIRPLLYTSRSTIEEIMKNFGYFIDGSASFPYQRNLIRKIHKTMEGVGIILNNISQTIQKHYEYIQWIIKDLPPSIQGYNYIMLKNFNTYSKSKIWHWINYHGKSLKNNFFIDMDINIHIEQNIVFNGLWLIKNNNNLIITYPPIKKCQKEIISLAPYTYIYYRNRKFIKNNTNNFWFITTLDNFFLPIYHWSHQNKILKPIIKSMMVVYNTDEIIVHEDLIYHGIYNNFSIKYTNFNENYIEI